MITAASVKRLCEIKDVTEEDAKRIRAIWHAVKMDDLIALYPDRKEEIITLTNQFRGAYRCLRRALIDEVLNTSGVEYLGTHKRSGEHIDYCNAGDTYSTTVIFIGQRLEVGCWGDYVDAGLVIEQECSL